MEWYIKVITNMFDFSSRARRTEFWMFVLVNAVVAFVLVFAVTLLKLPMIIFSVYQLGIMIPYLAVCVRRMHDVDHAGWWVMVPFYNLYLFVTEGTKGVNRFGADPKAGAAPTA